jgi:hypothetical protein
MHVTKHRRCVQMAVICAILCSDKNRAVRRALNTPTLQSELHARRVRWLQAICRWHWAGTPDLHVLESRFLWETMHQFALTGKLTAVTNPWSVQFYLDLRRVAQKNLVFQNIFCQVGWWSIYTTQFQKINTKKLKTYEVEETIVPAHTDYAQRF